MKPTLQEVLRQIPSVDTLLSSPEIQSILGEAPRWAQVAAVRQAVNALRQQLVAHPQQAVDILSTLSARIATELASLLQPSLRRVINATGVIIHTNLGRSLLSQAAQSRVAEVAAHYSTLEFDLDAGRRGSRHSHVERLLVELTGAEAAMVVNNNAAATFLMLAALVHGKEVLISRGQLVEIGGSFRMPDVMAASGSIMVEVGTTNKTHLRDYEQALSPETGAILYVHQSNFAIVGFSTMPSPAELVALGHRHQLPVLEDLGCGAFLNFASYGLHPEPTPKASIEAGMDVVAFSGDKLLGGPQAGILVGKAVYIDCIRKHSLARALRVDKFTVAALEATLRHYHDEQEARQEIPTLRLLTLPVDDLWKRAKRIKRRLHLPDHLQLNLIEGESEVGGGTMPLQKLPTVILALSSHQQSANQLEQTLRLERHPPIIGRIQANRVMLDLRTVLPEEDSELVAALNQFNSGS